MAFQLTPEQEARIRAAIDRGGYASPEQVLDAALDILESHSAPEFDGTEEELAALLNEGLASEQLTEDEFWSAVDRRIEDYRATRKTGSRR